MNQMSIQSFYSREVNGSAETPSKSAGKAILDGFTNREVQSHLQPQSLRAWNPPAEYPLFSISNLRTGHERVNIYGRVVSIRHDAIPIDRQPRRKGCWKLVIADDTGAINVGRPNQPCWCTGLLEKVKLWYDKVRFDLRFGQLLSVWSVHVAAHDPTLLATTNSYAFITIFPEVEQSCHIEVLDKDEYGSICRKPLDYNPEGLLLGLMTLRDFLDGGSELAGSKVLLVVKSVGSRKRLTVGKGTPRERPADMQVVRVFDDTAECSFTLWNEHCSSCHSWTPLSTVLLFTDAYLREPRSMSSLSYRSSPGSSAGDRTINLTPKSLLEVDPALPDAAWLRSHVQSKIQREHVNPVYPEGEFDIDEVCSAKSRFLFRLSDIDEYVRARPNELHVGWFSMVFFELGLMRLHARGQLCCNECCNLPLYANAVSAVCKQCNAQVSLRPNPRLIATLLDSTGALSGAKLVINPAAWPQLLGLTAAQLVVQAPADLRQREARMLYMRVTLLMGWSPGEGRLVLLSAES